MDNYKAENQEQEIDLVSLFFAVAHRYKQMAAAAVICAVLFGGFSVVKGMLNQRAIDEAIANGEEVPRTSAEQQYEEDMVEYREAQTKHDTDVTSYKQQLNQNEADQVRAQFDIDNAQEYIDKSVRQKLDRTMSIPRRPASISPPIIRSCLVWTTRTRTTPAPSSVLTTAC